MGDWQTKVLSFPVLGATSEKFILAIVLLDALLNGQGHERPIEAASWQVRSCGAPSRAEVTIDPPRQDSHPSLWWGHFGISASRSLADLRCKFC
jgi:hypothetical protein